jgi:DNA-binding NtrC family response regulator
VRELLNTLQRAAVWSEGDTIDEAVMGEAILDLSAAQRQHDGILHRPVEEGVDLPGMLEEVARHYLTRALDAAHGNKAKATKMLGLPNYQTLTNWMRRYGVTN